MLKKWIKRKKIIFMAKITFSPPEAFQKYLALTV